MSRFGCEHFPQSTFPLKHIRLLNKANNFSRGVNDDIKQPGDTRRNTQKYTESTCVAK